MRVAILGAGGQLASDLGQVMTDWDPILLSHSDLDICDHGDVRKNFGEIRPDVVINTAAFHRVDECEEQVEKAFAVNAFAVRNLAQVCAESNCMLVHISTDYVFGGEKRTPYSEDDLPNPLNVYGASKLAGEHFVSSICPKHFVVRTSGLYGLLGSRGERSNFVEDVIRLAEDGKPIRVVDDQVLAPTYTKDLAEKTVELLHEKSYGLYHIANSGKCSWYEFAVNILEIAGLDADLARTTTKAYGAKARRPAFSVLASKRPFGSGDNALRRWVESLGDYLSAR